MTLNMDLLKIKIHILKKIRKGVFEFDYFPGEIQTQSFYEKALKLNVFFAPYIPDKIIRSIQIDSLKKDLGFKQEIWFWLVKQNGENLKYVPDSYHNKKLFKLALETYPYAMYYINSRIIDEEMCLWTLNRNKYDETIIDLFPRHCLTKKVCFRAVEINPRALLWIPDEKKTIEMCKLCLKKPYTRINIPERFYIQLGLKTKVEKYHEQNQKYCYENRL